MSIEAKNINTNAVCKWHIFITYLRVTIILIATPITALNTGLNHAYVYSPSYYCLSMFLLLLSINLRVSILAPGQLIVFLILYSIVQCVIAYEFLNGRLLHPNHFCSSVDCFLLSKWLPVLKLLLFLLLRLRIAIDYFLFYFQ